MCIEGAPKSGGQWQEIDRHRNVKIGNGNDIDKPVTVQIAHGRALNIAPGMVGRKSLILEGKAS